MSKSWVPTEYEGIEKRDFDFGDPEDYQEYIALQVKKTKRCIGMGTDVGNVISIVQKHIPPGGRVLCLGARSGKEVVSFRTAGYWAIGIDLYTKNSHVIWGDFHYLPFKSRMFDVLFTNSLDHALDWKQLNKEMFRVLKSGGSAIIHALARKSAHESLTWSKGSDLVPHFERWWETNLIDDGRDSLLVLKKKKDVELWKRSELTQLSFDFKKRAEKTVKYRVEDKEAPILVDFPERKDRDLLKEAEGRWFCLKEEKEITRGQCKKNTNKQCKKSHKKGLRCVYYKYYRKQVKPWKEEEK